MVAQPIGYSLKAPRRSNSRRSLRSKGRTPSMQTIWEWAGNDIDVVPSTEDALIEGSSSTPPPRGQLWLRQTGLFPLRLFSRRHFLQRFAVLLPPHSLSGGPPRLQLFLVRRESAPAARTRIASIA